MKQILLALTLGLATPALACSLIEPEWLVVDIALSDGAAPPAPVLVTSDLGRGVATATNSQSGTCGNLGWAGFTVETQAGVGYQLDLASGTLPDGLDLAGYQLMMGSALYLHWLDELEGEQSPVHFVLEVRAVDEGGDVGPPLSVTFDDPGDLDSTSGCSAVGGGASWAWLLVGMVLVGWKGGRQTRKR